MELRIAKVTISFATVREEIAHPSFVITVKLLGGRVFPGASPSCPPKTALCFLVESVFAHVRLSPVMCSQVRVGHILSVCFVLESGLLAPLYVGRSFYRFLFILGFPHIWDQAL